MAKITRYNGNLRAFAVDALGTERTVFGEVTQADDLTSQLTADFLRGWGIVGPADQPSLQDFNAMGYTLGQLLAYLHQVGMPEYNATQEYHLYSMANLNGVTWVSLVNNNVGNTPDVSPTQWRELYPQATETVRGTGTVATQAEAEAGTSDTDLMTPLKVKQAIAVLASSLLDSTRIDVASAATINLTTGAPNTRHINITGTTTISAFTVAAGKCYFVRFNAALTLTNGAGLVTNTGANILTAAGDTCVIRATANNVVEVILYTAAKTVLGKNECTAWVNFNAVGTVTIRDSYNVASMTDSGVGDFFVNFLAAMNNTNYAATGTGSASDAQARFTGFTNTSVSQLRVLCQTSTPGAIDQPLVSVIVFGGK